VDFGRESKPEAAHGGKPGEAGPATLLAVEAVLQEGGARSAAGEGEGEGEGEGGEGTGGGVDSATRKGPRDGRGNLFLEITPHRNHPESLPRNHPCLPFF
jgi:hypothetical protein